jgi:Ribbon-helix-helix protein, copG family
LTLRFWRCTYITMVRTQLYLDEAIHRRLSGLARKQGRTISELVRDALVRTYGSPGADERRASLQAIEGLWRHRKDIPDTDEYVRRLRRSTRLLRP